MKKEYLKSLEKALEEYNVKDKKDILKKYSKRYDFGLDAGLSDDKIEEMLGDPISIAKKLADVIDVTFDEKREYDITVELSTEDLEFVFSKDEGVHVELEELEQSEYTIEKDDKHLMIKRNKINFFGQKINGSVRIEVPKGVELNKYEINLISSDLTAKELKAKEIYFHTTSSDINISNIYANEIRYETVSGDMSLNNLKAKDVHFETVSGDITIDSLISDDLSISSISGDINISSAYVSKVKSNTVSGDTFINGESVGYNVKNSIKNTFGKIKKAFKNENNN